MPRVWIRTYFFQAYRMRVERANPRAWSSAPVDRSLDDEDACYDRGIPFFFWLFRFVSDGAP